MLTIDGVEFWELPEYPSIAPAGDDTVYTTSRGDRIDRLSRRFYGTHDLWWVIAIANDINLIPSDFKENVDLRIPSTKRVFNDILRDATKRKEGR